MNLFDNITVLSLEQAIVLPYLTYRLALEGMDVIRLEHPVYGDPNRLIGQNVLGEERMNSYYLCINGQKRAVSLNLAAAEGQEIFRSLITELDIDVFATNQLPKNYQKLGIDYESIRKLKPDIIWLGVTGFGPQSNEAAYDPILQARSGLMELTGQKEGDPQVLGVPLPDMGTSEHCYGALMKALYKREITGQGSCLNMSMFDSSVSWMVLPLALYGSFGKVCSRTGNTHEFFCPVSVYRTKDGYVYLAVGNDRQWKSLVGLEPFKKLDKPEYERNEGRISDVDNLNRELNSITEQFASEQLIEMFQDLRIPISKIRKIPEVADDPLVSGRMLHSWDPVTNTRITLGPPPYDTDFLQQQNRRLSFPPRFGEHNTDILTNKLGYPQERLQRLRDNKII